jgi:hypothetical protein
MFLPPPVFWGAIAAWAPLPPSIMAGALCCAVVYALLDHLFSLREWQTEEIIDA